jgi:Fe-S-cluster-containing hydrogenase component 2
MTENGRLHVDAQKCTGCRICELVCSQAKEGAFNPKRSRIRVVKMERFFVDLPSTCRQCADAACEDACPARAVTKQPSGAMRVDEAACTGCGACAEACPFGAIAVGRATGKATVCDLCEGDPACVRWCPTEALTFRRPTDPGAKPSKASVPAARSLLMKWGIPLGEFEAQYGDGTKE